MGFIFCIMGMSATGKDTLFAELRSRYPSVLNPIVPYTTRPKRLAEIDGITYHFIDEETLQAYGEKGRIIEQRTYNTTLGPWHYATVDDGQIKLKEKNYITIITLEAYRSYQAYFGMDVVVPLYIQVPEDERLKRAVAREEKQEKPNYKEIKRRMQADIKDFDKARLQAAAIDRVYVNLNLKQCLDEITDVIDAYLRKDTL